MNTFIVWSVRELVVSYRASNEWTFDFWVVVCVPLLPLALHLLHTLSFVLVSLLGKPSMSSIMAVEQHQDPRNQPAGSDSSMAPEHVLRAAALRSLKAKRKKQQTVSTELSSTLPPRPAPPPDSSSIQLDYGQAESPSSIAFSSAPPPTSSKPETKMDVDDAAREEGEISDSEDAPTAPPSPVAPKQQPQAKKVPTPPAKPKPVPPKSPERKRVPTPPTPSTAVPRSSSITIETPRPTIFEPVIKASKALTDMLPPPLPIHHTSIVVDSYQARPGLNSELVVCY